MQPICFVIRRCGLMCAVLVATLNPWVSLAQEARSFTLKNGMTLLVKADARAPTAVHMLWVRVGSMDEVDGASGVAHVLEHMLFKGSVNLKPGEFDTSSFRSDNKVIKIDFAVYV